MKLYELTIVLDGAATKAQIKEKKEFVEKLVKISEGKITKTEDWGVKQLAYPIEKKDSGFFVYFEIEVAPAKIKEMNEKLRLEEGVIRYLLIKAE